MMKRICCFFFALMLSVMHISAAPRILYVSGETVLINAQYDGVLVSGNFEFSHNQKTIQDHPSDSIQVGDLIVQSGSKKIHNCTDLNETIAVQSITAEALNVTVLRNGEQLNAKLYLYFDNTNNTFKTGFYIKDHISGVGTLTYYDPLNHSYAALGHEITEKTTGKTADINDGSIELGNVIEIEPSVVNQPGEKISRSTGRHLGSIVFNNEYGLYGKYRQTSSYQMMEVGLQKEIHVGEASIMTVIDGTQVQSYKIKITKVNSQSSPAIKGIEFQITDERLLEHTGGIVQGMSGSPIIQNGKIIGAVTHMIPSAPFKGYGIFIEWMLKQSDLI